MKTILLSFFTLLIAAPAALSQSYTERQLQDMFMDMLEDRDIEGWIDADGDIQFEHGDYTMFIEINEEDNEFFRVVLPNIWPIESDSEEVMVAFACNAVNSTKKTVKAYITQDNVWIAIELFVKDQKNIEPIFDRSVDVIYEAVEMFVDNM